MTYFQNTEAPQYQRKRRTSLTHLITASISGIISRTLTCPLERVRVLQQTSTTFHNKSIGEALNFIYRRNGMKGFFRGNGVNIMIQAPYTAIEFYLYEVCKNNIYPGVAKEDLLYIQKIQCGAITGMIASCTLYPLDVVKTFLTIDKKQQKTSIINLGSDIVRKHGIRGFYNGLSLKVAGVTPFVAFRMSTFEYLNHNPSANKLNPMKGQPGGDMFWVSISGSVAGIVAVIMAYPFDPLKRMMQLNGTSKEHNYRNVFDLIWQIITKQGIRGFYRGFNATIIKAVPTNAILFLLNEKFKERAKINDE